MGLWLVHCWPGNRGKFQENATGQRGCSEADIGVRCKGVVWCGVMWFQRLLLLSFRHCGLCGAHLLFPMSAEPNHTHAYHQPG